MQEDKSGCFSLNGVYRYNDRCRRWVTISTVLFDRKNRSRSFLVT